VNCSVLLRILISAFFTYGSFAQTAVSQETALFSWWNASREDNFMTTDPRWSATISRLRSKGNHLANGRLQEGYRLYRLEGLIFSPRNPKPSGTVPLYSWYNPERGDNFISSDPRWSVDETSIVWTGEHLSMGRQQQGYRLYRLEGYIYDPRRSQPAGTIPVYSWYNPNRGDNFATTDPQWDMPPRDIIWNGHHIQNGLKQGGYSLYRLEGYAARPPQLPSTGVPVARPFLPPVTPPVRSGGSGTSCEGEGDFCGPIHPNMCFGRGSDWTVEGRISCASGKPVCKTVVGRDFCQGGGRSSFGLQCGGNTGDSCSADRLCAPGLTCGVRRVGNRFLNICTSLSDRQSSSRAVACKRVQGFCHLPEEVGDETLACAN